MNKLDEQYSDLLLTILEHGVDKSDRTGTGTKSIFGYTIRHNMKDGFPLLTTKKMAIKTMMTELKWFLKGDTNIKYLVDNNCKIWNGDAYKKYEKYAMDNSYGVDVLPMDEFIKQIKTDDEFARKWGELGPIYGAQWRNWFQEGEQIFEGDTLQGYTENSVDQIKNLIEQLKTNPDSRRLMVSAWNVGELDLMTLPPCHYGFQLYTRLLTDEERYDIWFTNNYQTGMERFFDPKNLPDFDKTYYEPTPKRALSLMWNQRSVDTFLGLPFNIASYATLLELISKEVFMVPDQLIGNLGDVHLYNNHLEQAKEQIKRKGYELPSIHLKNINLLKGEFNYNIDNYEYHPTIKAPLSN
jgi:thymidylate synthase